MAARKVADENRKLRGLLALSGIGDDSIEAYLQSSPAGDVQLGSQIPSHSVPVQALQHLLQTRKPCCSETRTGLPVHNGEAGSREGSLTSVSTAQSSRDLSRLPASGSLHHTGKSTSHQFVTPSSTRSTTSSISYHSHHSVPRHQTLSSSSLRRNPSPTSMANQPQMYELDPRLTQSNPSQYLSHQSTSHQLHSHSALGSPYVPTTTASPNVNSCVFAADMISSMAGGDPSTVSADLGCLPGMDCEVDNQLVFNVIDRYTEPTVGI